MPRSLVLAIENDDVVTFRADVVALKYANGFHGADEAVAEKLGPHAANRVEQATGTVDDYLLVETKGRIEARRALFVGVGRLTGFRYPEIRRYFTRVLQILALEAPETRHLVTTIHGPNYGLDERESLVYQLAGFLEALKAGRFPEKLARITIVERNRGRVERLRVALGEILEGEPSASCEGGVHRLALDVPAGPVAHQSAAPQQGVPAEIQVEKRYIFVAMPFSDEMIDVFYYGIQAPIHRHGFICERIDHSTFVGDIVEQIRLKIDGAAAVVADLTGSNPNVYLEVGYAWARGRPTILITRNLADLQFDVRGQKCLAYGSIKKLEENLDLVLAELQAQKVI